MIPFLKIVFLAKTSYITKQKENTMKKNCCYDLRRKNIRRQEKLL